MKIAVCRAKWQLCIISGMKLSRFLLVPLLLLSPLPKAAAQALPDLKSQASWGEKEKQEFLKHLKSNQELPSGLVKNVPASPGSRAGSHKARYLSLSPLSDALIVVGSDGKLNTGEPSFGARLAAGGHLFSWIRYYAGVKYTRLKQEKLDGSRARLTHYEFPAGIELALIPLGTPHTRYVVMRVGLSEHYFSSSAKGSDFQTSVKGWHPAWNAGIGYEWQVPDTRWRVNILTEGYRSFAGGKTPEFYGIGLTAGLAYTF